LRIRIKGRRGQKDKRGGKRQRGKLDLPKILELEEEYDINNKS
jgi:hypothetical protein